jgi:hypothetical protein
MKTWHWISLGLLTVIGVVAQSAGEPGHGAWSHIPAFWSFFGFVGCVLIIVISKAIGKYILQRGEDYYDES